ncbi:MAG: class I SAM-dependent methyltransferase [Sorangiineae bacterium]|nr:class I SAM-dependent methyltransferase [Polyangiaceae bacterium]MEB2323859.1 class I SAM-dependent methyltransferase [Sorangiineae bacterium]
MNTRTSAGGVDWRARWREMFSAAAGEAAPRADDPWRHRAARFDRLGRERANAALEHLGAELRPTDVLADLGAGTCRHAVPLARRAARVIAVEPSAAMRALLEARLREERANVSVVAASFPCPLEPVDVVYSCHVLYAIAEAAEFLDAMTRAARRTCRLVLGLRAPSERIAPLWQAVHGTPRPPRPAALEAFALLHQLGHEASLRVIPGAMEPMTFSRSRDDLDELCHRLHLAPGPDERARVEAALDATFPSASREGWRAGESASSALIEWPGRG